MDSAGQAETARKVTASVADDKGLIGTIQKNRATELRVSLTRYKGRDLVDIREWAKPFNGGDTVPTGKGTCFALEHLPEFNRLCRAAWAEAKAKGLAGEA